MQELIIVRKLNLHQKVNDVRFGPYSRGSERKWYKPLPPVLRLLLSKAVT